MGLIDSGGFGGTGNGSIGVVIVFLTTTGFSTGFLIGSGGLGKVIIFLGGGFGKGCVMGRFIITTVSRTTRCTGAVCNINHSNPICNTDTANNAGRDKRTPGSCGAVVVTIMTEMIKAFAATPAKRPTRARKQKLTSLAPNRQRRPQSSPPSSAPQFDLPQTPR